MKKLVLSGINLFSGGTLEIYRKFLEEIGRLGYDQRYKITAFVYRKTLFEDILCDVSYIELPDARKNYALRLYYEEIFFYNWSRDKNIDVWIAMHDITPRVVAKNIYTYYHTPHIFYRMPKKKILLDLRCYLMTKLYRYFVALNINDLSGIIVQANWIKEKFGSIFNVRNIIVARPEEKMENIQSIYLPSTTITFFYPSFSRVFKNFEVICEACKILNEKGHKYQVIFTIKGDENKYARWLYKKYKDVKNIRWIGVQRRDVIEEMYKKYDVLIFPSTLETWGLPINEWGKYGKPMLLADLRYSHETARNEINKEFFNVNDHIRLAELMEQCILNTEYLRNSVRQERTIEKHDEWKKLLETLLGKYEKDT